MHRSLRNKVNVILRSAKSKYFNDLSSSLRSNPCKFWKHFQSLSKDSKPVSDIHFSVTADIFNNHFLTIPYKTIADVSSTVQASEFVEEFIADRVVPPLQFASVSVETISSFVANLDVHKAAGTDGLPPRFLRLLLTW